MKKILLLLGLLFLTVSVTGCSNGKLKAINYNQLEKMMNEKETFILEVVQTGCSACEDFTPRFTNVLKVNNITAYSINITNLSNEDKEKFNQVVNINSTPTVVFYNKGEEESVSYRIIGAVSNEKIEQKLKAQDYIK